MKLSLLKKDLAARTVAFHDREIKGITCDSRDVADGMLFVAMFAVEAVANGAAAVVVQRKLELPNTTQLIVPDTRVAYALLSARFYGFPSELLKLAGITGTNGKTTVSWMLRSIIEASGKSCGLIGTVNYSAGNRCIPAKNTTPSPHERLHSMTARSRA